MGESHLQYLICYLGKGVRGRSREWVSSYFMRQTLTEPEAHNFSNVGWQQVPEICLAVQPKSGLQTGM